MSRKRKNTTNKRIKKRIEIFFIASIVLFSGLIYRIFSLSILKNDEYEKRIQNQSMETVNLNSGRGIIYDKNKIPITDTQKKKVLLVPRDVVNGNFEGVTLIKSATNLTEKDIYKAVQKQLSSQIIQIEVDKVDENKLEELKNNNILVKEKIERYSDDILLTHLIGYTTKADNNGVSGIERYMNDELKDSNKNYVSVFKAGENKGGLTYLKGSIKQVQDNEEDKNLKLTIDLKTQKKVEKIMDNEENPSAVIISDVQSGKIISMCSRPNFRQNDMLSYNNSENGELQNRALGVTYPPGSVFKLVVLYAALDNNIIDDNYMYDCTGKTTVGTNGEVLNCNNSKVHGKQTLSDAVANSCNTAFYDIAKRVGSKKIFKAIETLHLDEKVDIGIEEEKNAKIPDEIALSNLAIGQANIEFTPLQINQLTQTIANNGTYKPLYIYDSLIDDDMNTIKIFKSNKLSQVISPYTMTRIKDMMMQVSKTGTAKLLVDLNGGCGVKTGTAQSSLKGKKISHGWITGFYPEINPKYAITIIVEGTEKESKSAIPIFKEICENLN